LVYPPLYMPEPEPEPELEPEPVAELELEPVFDTFFGWLLIMHPG